MKKYKFSTTERFIIWQSYDNKCFWCGEPLKFKETTIDHVFPEKLLLNLNDLDKIKRAYSLPKEFSINDFCNWVPAHGICNAKKSISIVTNSPMFLLLVDKIQEKASQIKHRYDKFKIQASKDKVIAKLLTDLENGNITNDDLLKLFETTSVYYFERPKIKDNELTHLPTGWKVMSIDRKDKTIRVTDGRIAGLIPIEIEPHMSWWCNTCNSYGPWDGNKCCLCGHYDYPN